MTDADPLLSLQDVSAGYDETSVLEDVSLSVEEGEVVSLIGPNGAGKTTTLKTIMGQLPVTSGAIRFDGESITGLDPEEIYRRGIGIVPEHREVFPGLTVLENLRMGGVATDEGWLDIEGAYEYFPRLRERKGNLGRQLSGGEKQMLSIARALMGETELLLLDEPTEGLAPQIVEDIVEIVETLSEDGLTVLLVEQNLSAVMDVADRHYILANGEIVYDGTTTELAENEDVRQRYIGVTRN
jgi:branched-chain amino acid transport system ATP-binding protein